MKSFKAKAKVIKDMIFFGKVSLKKGQIIDITLRKLHKKMKKNQINFTQFFYGSMPIHSDDVNVLEVYRADA